MVQMTFTPEEQQLLTAILEQQMSDLRYEIGATDERNYRQMLKEREKLLVALLEKVRAVGKVPQHV